MALAPGTRLGPYTISASIGAGGMGEVYKATDTRLGRTVAIKVLPELVALDPELKQRFEREAKALAALSHPHICPIHDVGSQGGIDFLVMEYLDGETLEQRLKKGPLPLDLGLQIGIQIADALAAAHRAGITHRDLKPGNIMLTKSGAKLLDFGLAKLRPASPVSMSGMTRLSTMAPGTASGTILGTVHYMAPEQVEGRDADGRSDVWALGAVLYEIVTGTRPFKGESPASVIAAILKDTPPPLSARQPLTPALLDQIVTRCISKDPEERWQSASDLRIQLEWIKNTPVASVASEPPRHRRRNVIWGVTIGAVTVLVVAAAMLMTRASSLTADPLVSTVARVTHETGFSEWPTWSPDGSLFAFTSNRAGNFDLYVGRAEEGREVVNVTSNDADDVQPAFSPDGKLIAYVSTRSSQTGLIKIGTFIGFDTRTFGGDVWVTPALGGQARRLAEGGNFPVWYPDGRSVLYVSGPENRRAIMAVSVEGGAAPTTVLPSSESRWEIIRLGFSPDARWITFETQERQILAMPAVGGRPTTLLEGSSHVWDRTARRIYYVNQQSTGGTRIEGAEIQPGTELPVVVRGWVAGVSTGTLRDLALAPDGTRLLAAGADESMNLTRIRLSPEGGDVAGPEESLSTGHVRDRFPAASPDGERIVVSTNRIGDNGLWIVVPASGRWTRVEMPQVPDERVVIACWAPNGRDLGVKRFLRDGRSALWRVAVDGSAAEPLVQPAPTLVGTFACAFSPDGQGLLYARIVDGFNQLFVFDLTTRRDRALTHSGSHKYQGAWSPDGRWITFSANTGETVHTWRVPAAGGREEQLTNGAERYLHMFYSPDGRWLYVQPSHRNIYRMPADGGPLRPVTRFPESGLFIEEPTIAPNGQYLAYNRGGGGSSLWMLTFTAAPSAVGP
jgi:serine/threonine-protein kinase